jgi:hypothetical protein
MEQLCEAVCKLHKARINRSRLLWDLYVIDGLEGGKVAVYAKVHHGIIDGRTFVKIVDTWLSTSARAKTVRAMWEGVARGPRVSRPRPTLAKRIGDSVTRAADTTTTAVALGRMLGKQLLASLGMGGGMTLPMLNVPAAFHGKPSAQRSFAFAHFRSQTSRRSHERIRQPSTTCCWRSPTSP